MSTISRHWRRNIDHRGNELVVGQRVAYNYSGDVAVGVIHKITPSEIHILREHPSNTKASISRVKNARSVLVLLPEEQLWTD